MTWATGWAEATCARLGRRAVARAAAAAHAAAAADGPRPSRRRGSTRRRRCLAASSGSRAFERDVLLLGARAGAAARSRHLSAALTASDQRPWPTFGLALAACPARTGARCRRRAAARAGSSSSSGPGDSLTAAALGSTSGSSTTWPASTTSTPGSPVWSRPPRPAAAGRQSHAAVAERAAALGDAGARTARCGAAGAAAAAAAAAAAGAARRLGLGLLVVPTAARRPSASSLARLWAREAVLSALLLVVDARRRRRPAERRRALDVDRLDPARC